MKKIFLAMALSVLSGPVFAADMPVKVPPPKAHGFGSCYIGGNVGWARAQVNDFWAADIAGFGAASVSAINAISVAKLSSSGVIGGGQIGCNFQTSGWVVWGIEGDFQGAGFRTTRIAPFIVGVVTGTEEETFKVSWISTARARVGTTFFSNWFFYGTAGLAFANITYRDCEIRVVAAVCDTTGASGAFNLVNFNQTRFGYAAGVGTEVLFGKWSVKGEYLYVGIPAVTTITQQASPFAAGFDIAHFHRRDNIQIVRVGLNYHFWCCGPAVVRAAY